ncbi:TGF-beta-activated kinase 1 and MAP3K7-binding protein 3-like [Oscarella lobularis]|uniref:TGF-beta-activated kinase 1 and MAP3K7-binding protein 3-like n=1 Tax=Oscarella lobularis TaxID=121494 RepID=UPI0033132257
MAVDPRKLASLCERFPHFASETISNLLARNNNDVARVQSLLSEDLYNGEEKNNWDVKTPYRKQNSVTSNHDPNQALSPTSPDYAYVQALLLHQRARLEAMSQSVYQTQESLRQLEQEVREKEQQHSELVSDYSGIPSDEDLDVLRAEVQSLETTVHDMRRECQALKAARQRGETSSTPEESHWACEHCSFHNHPALTRCEMCEIPRSKRQGVSPAGAAATAAGTGGDQGGRFGNFS